jgi:sporulation protein YlmC with PRC-barrel domain
MICTSDLQGKNVRSDSGKRLGRVFEIQVNEGQVEALICGGGGLWRRLMSAQTGHRVPWNLVRKIDKEILIAD